MKSLSTVILLGFSCILLNQASAEPFNDRSPEGNAVISSGKTMIAGSENQPTLAETGFNDRGPDWLATVVPSRGSRNCQLNGYFASSHGFNDKSFVPSNVDPSLVSGKIAASSSTRPDDLC